MKLKISYIVKGKPVTKYHQNEKEAFESMMLKVKYGWSVTAIELVH